LEIDWVHHQPSLASRATARQATWTFEAKRAKAAAPKPAGRRRAARCSTFTCCRARHLLASAMLASPASRCELASAQGHECRVGESGPVRAHPVQWRRARHSPGAAREAPPREGRFRPFAAWGKTTLELLSSKVHRSNISCSLDWGTRDHRRWPVFPASTPSSSLVRSVSRVETRSQETVLTTAIG
jgi:hypothetical protein